MSESFEAWAAKEVERLRRQAAALQAEADALESAMRRYAAEQTTALPDVTWRDGVERWTAARVGAITPRPATALTIGVKRGSNRNKIMLDALRRAPNQALGRQQLIQVTREAGDEIPNNSLRSFLWTMKDRGILRQLPDDRWQLIVPEAEQTSSHSESTAGAAADQENGGTVAVATSPPDHK